jgi:TonB-dependent starch-binding outer membrane protein SusC
MLGLLLAGGQRAEAQAVGTIAGQVTGTNGQPLVGATVAVTGTTRGARTSADGRYTITAVPAGSRTVRASFAGYTEATRTTTVAAGQTATVNIQLSQQALQLEGIVAVGYGGQRRSDVTGSIGTVSREVISASPVTSASQALVGQIAGVNVTTATGMPGSAPKIQVRGVGAVGAGSQPLYVVDGYALPQPENQIEARLRDPLASIPVQDIESITVLKDASATAIYGSRASNGVVIITTKSGRAGQRRIQVSANSGVSNEIAWMRPEMATARQFATWQNRRYQDMVSRGAAKEIPAPYRNPEQYGAGTDWFDLVSRPAYTANVDASVSGGSQSVRSFFSGGYSQQQGTVPGTDFTRLSLRANIDSDLAPWLEAGLRLAPTYNRRRQPGVGEGRTSATGLVMLACPIASPTDSAGNTRTYIDSSQECPGVWTVPNPLHLLENVTDEQTTLRVIGSANLKFDIGGGLTANTNLSTDWQQGDRDVFNPSTIGGANSLPPSVPTGSFTGSRNVNWTSESTVNLARDLGPGQIDALAGFTVQQQVNDAAVFSGIFPDDNIRTLNVASNLVSTSSEENWALLSYLGRLQYSWLDRYVLTGTLRTDGSSRFGVQNRWGTFPSAALAWNVHEESFMGGLTDVLPELRLRLSWGKTGNNQVGNYSSLGVVQRDDYLYGRSVAGGSRVTTLGNEALGWESTSEWNAGLDLGLLDRRVRATVDAYDRMTSDLLVARALSTTSGFATVVDNQGSVRNRGLEVSVTTQNLSTDDFRWTSDFSFAMNRNKVISLPGDKPIFTGSWGGNPTHMTAVGQPLGVYIGLVRDGIYQNAQEIADAPRDPGVRPGDVRWKDVNGDGVITVGVPGVGDYAVIGDPYPDFTFGITNAVTLGRFDLRASITGRKGGDVFRFGYYQSAMNFEGVFNVAAEYVENMWVSPEQPGNGEFPGPNGSLENVRRFHTNHDGAVADGSNLWLRNVNLRYSVPENIPGLGGGGVYVSVQNPFILTRFRGNPEVESNTVNSGLTPGLENFAYPIARQLTLGIDLNL